MAEYILGYWLVEPIEFVTVQDSQAGVERVNRSSIVGATTVGIVEGLELGVRPPVVGLEVVTARYLKAASFVGNHPTHVRATGCELSPPVTHEVRQTGWAGQWNDREWSSSSTVSGICIQVTTENI